MYNAKCEEIVYFLALSGKHNVRPNVQILYQDALISHGNLYVKTFKQMVDEVLYPSYQKRFQNRNDFMRKTTFVNDFGVANVEDPFAASSLSSTCQSNDQAH